MQYFKNIKAWTKAVKIDEYNAATGSNVIMRETNQGIVLNEKILIALNHSKWKKVGTLDWYPYYGITKLLTALLDDRLDEYAEKEQSSTRTICSPPIHHKWKNKVDEAFKRAKYEGKKGLFTSL